MDAQTAIKIADLEVKVEELNQMVAKMEAAMWKALDNHANHIEKMLDAWKRHELQHSGEEFKVTL